MAEIEIREFRVCARHIESHHAHLVREVSYEAAAVAYLDDYPWVGNDDHEVSVIVQEIASGHSRCFRVDLDTGQTALCE